MNHAYMQQLQTKQNQGQNLGDAAALLDGKPGLRLGQMATINPAKDGLTPAATALASAPGQVKKIIDDASSQTLGQTFANEIIRRMGEELGEDGQPKDTSGLNASLASTMDWIRDRFGDDTAAAAAGMILQSTSSGVKEGTLGEGLLNTLKFIDRNFGISAGDAVMAEFNSGINQELNSYFDNGKSELFFDAGAQSDGMSASQDITTRFFAQVQDASADEADSIDLTEQLLEDLKTELDKVAELQDLTSKLEAEFNPTKATTEAAMAAYGATPQFAEPQLASMTV
ncbi:hypothetical protein [Pseudodesulfovibrio sediminis]|uniref:DUF5610 domain-containing protein n=1 Tax=Pseudodesulfovibrio sediminis TaxID=2810563 RepID=A0ABM7P779_9BACT|nr:hypothetical protein [Pseudodesulfovibrio sediminis]BCS89216.1 hypothetical protein PSDVSF_24580 [Pseudodesulfovibrio sediminis]